VHYLDAIRRDLLDLHVSDDGRGFDQEAVRKSHSYGVLGMSEPARLIGGSLLIDSAPGMGTSVSIHIPLESESLS
jgi:signal transduction histidine kinase